MAARSFPTLPTYTTGQQMTSTLLNQMNTYAAFWADPPMFRMHQGTSQNVASGTPTQVTMDTLDYDTDSGRQTSTPWSYVIPFTGRWTFAAAVNIAGNATGYRYPAFYQNGAAVTGGKSNMPVNAAGNSSVPIVSITIACVAGDTIGAYMIQNSGSTLATVVSDLSQTSFLEGRMVSGGTP